MERNSCNVVRVDGSILRVSDKATACDDYKRAIAAYLGEVVGKVAELDLRVPAQQARGSGPD